MRLQIADIIYHQEQGTLNSAAGEVVLEPKANALLSYFCANAHEDISRDTLMQDVWRGQIVSDNAINRVIVQLRKALGDEQTPRQFIATVPKYGYRFIADAKVLEDESSELGTAGTQEKRQLKWLMLLLGLIALGVLFLIFRGMDTSDTNTSNQNLVPLSRLSNWQFEADLSDDQRHLVYSMSVDGIAVIHLTDLETQSAKTISDTSGDAYAGHWSHAGDKLVYQFIKEDQCEFHLVKMLDGEPQPPEVLQTCIAESYATFAFSPDDQILYFVERPGRYLPYELFAMDLEQQNKWRLSQPLPAGLGGHYINVHPETGRLLLVTESIPGESSLFELDAAANSYKKLLDLDYRISSAIWGHEKNTIVHQDKHPSYELLQTNLRTTESKVLVSDSRRITHPRRINNQKDYLFTSYLNNLDIVLPQHEVSTFNSTVMDYLPSLSRDGQRLAFISKRSGYSKVWIKHLNNDELVSIEPDDTGRTFYSLDWSFDNQSILANTNRGLIVFDLNTLKVSKIIKLEQQAYAAYWSAENVITYSHHEQDRWNIYQSDLSGEKVEKLDSDYAFMLSNSQRTIYLDQELNLIDESGAPIAGRDEMVCGMLVMRYQLTVQLDGESLYCVDKSDSDNLLHWQATVGFQKIEGALDGAYYYSMKGSRLAKTNQVNANSDIMRTRF